MRKHTSRRRKTNRGSNTPNGVDHQIPQEETQDDSLVDEHIEDSISTESQDEPVFETDDQGFEDDTVDSSEDEVEEAPVQPKKKKGLWLGVGIVTLFAVGVVVGYCGMMNSSKDTSTQAKQDEVSQVVPSDADIASDENKDVLSHTESQESTVSNEVVDTHQEAAIDVPTKAEPQDEANSDEMTSSKEISSEGVADHQETAVDVVTKSEPQDEANNNEMISSKETSSEGVADKVEDMASQVQEAAENLETSEPVAEASAQEVAVVAPQGESITAEDQKEMQSESVPVEQTPLNDDVSEGAPLSEQLPVVESSVNPVEEQQHNPPVEEEVSSQGAASSEASVENVIEVMPESSVEASQDASTIEVVTPASVDSALVDEKLAQLNAALKEAQESLLMKEEQIKVLEQKMAQEPEQMNIMLGQVKQYILSAKRQVAVSRVDLALDNVRAAKALVDLSSSTLLRPLKEDLDADMVELKALGAIDRDILYVQLDEMTRIIDRLNFIYPDLELKGRPATHTNQSTISSEQSTASQEGGWLDVVKEIPSQVVDFLSSDMKGMVRVEKADSSVSLMSMEEASVLKERMKLEVTVLKNSLLNNNEALWSRTIQGLRDTLTQYFDKDMADVQQLDAQLNSLLGTSIRFNVKGFDHTLKLIQGIEEQLSGE